ncbi:large subunit GTPase 1 homolog [Lytechinus pictus]|uniref:large subunit GTPase 1 homolog n=1 Tax=Lytechinus pictus TaxID=7653 RepID=UPI0030B9FFBD
MGRKKGATSSLGKGILKDRSKSSKSSIVNDSWLHTSELNDGYDWNRINLRSVTEQSNLEDFLETAELAGTEFTAERLNVKVIDPGQHTGLPSATESIEISKAQRENLAFLQIPRRPKWDSTTSAEQLNQMEKEAFLEWRRELSLLQEKDHIVLTPFERNLDFWRQLWRVIERSDVIVQIVDARNPLLFRCLDLEKYVKEVSSDKENIILISKADLLTQAQREKWGKYFSQQGIRVAFWSAVRETERIEEKEGKEGEPAMADDENDDDSEDEEEEEDDDDDAEEEEDGAQRLSPDNYLPSSMEGMVVSSTDKAGDPSNTNESWNSIADQGQISGAMLHTTEATRSIQTNEQDLRTGGDSLCNESNAVPSRTDMDALSSPRCDDDMDDDVDDVVDSHGDNLSRTTHVASGGAGDGVAMETSCAPSPPEGEIQNLSHLLTGEELLGFFREVHMGRSKVNAEILTMGMVGYPNVGKSSTINALLREKKVPVSATPGRTKHFQTLFVEPTLCLCDCPGLVMPSFVSTKADMYLNGILPIDQMRDFTPPVSLMCQRVPRDVLELTYGINLIEPGEGEDQDRPPTALELLNAHAYVRGFMTQKGVPDSFRSARIVLKDYVNGKILYSIPPPGLSPEEFGSMHYPSLEVGEVKAGSRPKKSANKPMITAGGQTVKKSAAKKVDESFFAKPQVAHTKASAPRVGVVGGVSGGVAGGVPGVGYLGKPWKKQKRGKKEKLRKVYGHLDEK